MPDRYASPRDMLPPQFGPTEPAGRSPAMRRRLKVFAATFALCLLLGQGYNFSRSAVFEAHAKLQVTAAGRMAATSDAPEFMVGPDDKQAALLEAEVLGSRELLEKAVQRLQAQGFLAQLDVTAAVFAVQDMISITPLDGAQLLQVQARSHEKHLVARLVNTLVEVYREEQASSGQSAAQRQLAETRDELQIVSAKVAQKQQSLDRYRQNSNIVSTERDENHSVSRLKGLSTSLSTAIDREATAAGRIRAIEQAIAEGKRLPLARNNGTISNIEQRLSQQREELRALERQFTPQYLDLDPAARALKTRITNLEQQLESEQLKAQQTALAEAREELASSSATAQRLRQQLAGDKQEVQTFNRQLGTVQTLQTELVGLQQMQQAVQKKLLALEATQAARQPRLLVLESAVTPEAASSPRYGRDAALVLAGSLLLAFLAVWFIEFFNRSERVQLPTQTTLILPQPWPASSTDGMDTRPQLGPPPHVRLPSPMPQALQISGPLPRELMPHEVSQLLAAAAPCNLALLNCLLCGLSAEEAATLELRHADLLRGELQVPGDGRRSLPLPPAVQQYAEQCVIAASADDAPLFLASGERALSADDIEAIVTATAYDAHLDEAQSVTAASLRHTYIAFLVRQGLRFGELGVLVGRLGPDRLKALTTLAPQTERVALDAVERLLPILRRQPS
jgi:polysaccharide biosynthesis transport protein